MTADREDAPITDGAAGWVGRSIPRFRRCGASPGVGATSRRSARPPGTFEATILRSPHAHAEIEAIDCEAARTADGVAAVLTGADVKALDLSLVVGVKAPLECWPIAVDRVRYVGEPVAIVVASDRYRAEDLLVDLIEVRYRPLSAVVDPVAAATADLPLLHPAVNSNVVGERTFRYGDPERAFAEAAHRVRVEVRYPRNSCTPIETYGIVAEYDAGEDVYDVLANFQGPFSLHPVMARALKVTGNRSPASAHTAGFRRQLLRQASDLSLHCVDGNCVAGRRPAGEMDRGSPGTSLRIGVSDQPRHHAGSRGRSRRAHYGARFDQVEDCGAHLRAPEPATLYRVHQGDLTGAYDIRRTRHGTSSCRGHQPTPIRLIRLGGPQVYHRLNRARFSALPSRVRSRSA